MIAECFGDHGHEIFASARTTANCQSRLLLPWRPRSHRHATSLILPADATSAIFVCDACGNWRCWSFNARAPCLSQAVQEIRLQSRRCRISRPHIGRQNRARLSTLSRSNDQIADLGGRGVTSRKIFRSLLPAVCARIVTYPVRCRPAEPSQACWDAKGKWVGHAARVGIISVVNLNAVSMCCEWQR